MGCWRNFKRRCHVISFTVKSLSYNSSRSPNHYIDSAFEPLFWFVDNFTAYLGLLFVFAVLLGTSSVVVVWYMFLFPIIQTYSNLWFWLHCIVAHYLLINILFHYYKAVTTRPGSPSDDIEISKIERSVICKKCITSKPPRTHHCSICSKCYFKMDHHCPWMNTCIGFHNHRYFICFCIFMWMGVVYVAIATFRIFLYHVFNPDLILGSPLSISFSLGIQPFLGNKQDNSSRNFIKDRLKEMAGNYGPHPAAFTEVHEYEHIAIVYLFVLCASVMVALSVLNMWHITLVFRGETSIEVHINSSERKLAAKRGMGYNNPYNYGWKENWKQLLGLNEKRGFLKVIFPSSHLPDGDGMRWKLNGKPSHFPDPEAYVRYEKQLKKKWCCFC